MDMKEEVYRRLKTPELFFVILFSAVIITMAGMPMLIMALFFLGLALISVLIKLPQQQYVKKD